jgi:hypothetical protein
MVSGFVGLGRGEEVYSQTTTQGVGKGGTREERREERLADLTSLSPLRISSLLES